MSAKTEGVVDSAVDSNIFRDACLEEDAVAPKPLEMNNSFLDASCQSKLLPTLADFLGKARHEESRRAIEQVEADEPINHDNKFRCRQRPLTDAKVVFQQNAWDDVDWDEEQKVEAALKVEHNSSTFVNEEERTMLEVDASQNWSKFYGIHQNKFFRTRTWLFTEFPDLIGPFGATADPHHSKVESEKKRMKEKFPGENSQFRILEVGCGNGSTVLPFLSYNNHPETYIYCCDFSEEAVQIVAQHPELDRNRCTPFTWDITRENSSLPFPPESLDIVTMIFVLSAISPEKFDKVLQNVHNVLKPGGLILFRDYGVHDLVQLRIKPGRCISQNFYFRGDGTRVYFFNEAEVEDLFLRNGYSKLALFTDKRLQVNRLKQLKMYRVWLQAKYRKS